MSATQTNWLQVYVDAVMEKDPYKRLALVRKLKEMPKDDVSNGPVESATERPRATLPNTTPTNTTPTQISPLRLGTTDTGH